MLAAAILAVFTIATFVGDTTSAAVVAGAFSMFNTILLTHNARETRRVRKVITAPRRMVYDHHGTPIGTVLELDTDVRQAWHVQARRRRDDDEVQL